MKKYTFLFVILLSINFSASGFNARGGEIGYQCSSGFTYYLYVIIWGENLSPTDTFCLSYGDNTNEILTGANAVSNSSLASSLPSNFQNMVQVTWSFPHTFPGPGTYNQSVSCINRVAGIDNIPGSNNTTLNLNTWINIDPNIGCNSAPVNLNVIYMFFPLMSQSNTYALNYGEPNNDSLSYAFVSCNEPGYSYPNILGGGNFSINTVTGQFTWDNPTTQGIYNLMLTVTQWKHIGNTVVSVGYHEQEIQFVVDAANDVAETNANNLISFFPNPASSSITFQLPNSSASEMVIRDQFGREVRRQRVDGEKQIEISVEGLADGLYFFQRIDNDAVIESGKFIVQQLF
jgi:hypothetical protein